jgi:hypothetical protein
LNKGEQPSGADAVLSLRSYFQFFDDRVISRLESLFDAANYFFDTLSSRVVLTLLPKLSDSRFVGVMREVLKAPSLFKTLDIQQKTSAGFVAW